MQERAKIVEIHGDVVSVVPLDIEACTGCSNTECKKNGNVFHALNRRKFALVTGIEVKIAAPIRNQLWQAFFSVALPVLLAIAAYVAVPAFAPTVDEGVRVGASLLTLVAAMVLVYLARRNRLNDLPEVIEVL